MKWEKSSAYEKLRLPSNADYRTIGRWEHESVLERHRTRMQGAGELMRRRFGIVEHPFGTLKCRAGYRHFLVRGFDKVRGEWSLMALCYNFTRVLNILGFDAFLAALAKTLAPCRRHPRSPPAVHPGCSSGLLDQYTASARNRPARTGLPPLTSNSCSVSPDYVAGAIDRKRHDEEATKLVHWRTETTLPVEHRPS
ncbi:transposase [Bradyrhizobium barranii subsp. barranii]|uniref:Transposase n=1 Tax=Bradyrhizobium barranii subsp. barranii TaxID=2823807 RepID=A0A9X9YBX3_9BRAD|nr:transposase [Bradyrhizobium barranii subsp. barranii]